MENLEHQLHPKLLNKSTEILDVLLHQKFECLVKTVESLITKKIHSPDRLPVKRQKLISLNENENYSTNSSSLNENIICFHSKLNYFFSKKFDFNFNRPLKFELKINWKYDTLKCVDATPLFAYFKDGDVEHEYVFIGSHSRQFMCLDANDGNLIWKFEANGSL